MRKLNQNGTGYVEIILILVAVAILGFTGWFVWRSQQSTNKTIDETNRSTAWNPVTTKTNNSIQAGSQQYMTIKEWGVKIPLSSSDAGAYYKADSYIKQSMIKPTNLIVYATEIDNLTGPAGVSCRGEYVAYLMRLPSNDSRWQPSKSADDGNVSPRFGERRVIGDYRYAIATQKQYGPACWQESKTSNSTPDPATYQKFENVVTAFADGFENIVVDN